MEKAKRIVLTVGGIVSCVCCFIWLITGCVYIAVAESTSFIERLADESSTKTAEEIKALFLVVGIIFLCASVFCIANAIVALKGKNSDSKGLMIANIVFGFLSLIEITVVGGIFGIVAINRKNNSKPKIIEE